MPILEIAGGVRLYYELQGPENGPALVFLSGLTGDHNNWWLQVQSFSNEYRCLTFDWRDTGLSEISETAGYRLVDMASDVAGLIEGLNLGRSHLVGLSMGGAVAQEVAFGYPELVASLTIASSFAVRPVPTLLPENKRTPGNLRHWEAISRHDTRERLPSLQLQVMVVAGARDTVTPADDQAAFASLIPGAQFVKLEGAGHLVQVEKAGEFNRRLRAFLESLTRSGSGVQKFQSN